MRVAVCQIDPHIAEPAFNLAMIEQEMARLAADHVQLAVYPECAVSGYVFSSLREAMLVAEPIPGPATDRLAAASTRCQMYAVTGMLERDGDACFNTAILTGPEGLISVYRKTHILCMGVDRFTTPGGGPLRVYNLPFGRIGILICYDLRFPETARALALEGVQAIVVPTNWPETSFIQADVFTRSRAAENRVFVLAANRTGEERGTRFLGRSQIVGVDGVVLAEASRQEIESVVLDIELSDADTKHVVVSAGEHEMDGISDRRPDLYGALVRSNRLAEVG